MRSELALAGLALALVALPGSARAAVFHSREEALEMAFPDADRVESNTYVLRDEQVERVQALARCKLDSKLVKVYKGMRGDEVLGYAMIDVHTVRTLPEAFMVVLTPAGEVRSLRLLAFHEPLDYKPADPWYDQFDHKSLAEPLRLGSDVHGIVGATLSAGATTAGVRRALALYEVLIGSGS